MPKSIRETIGGVAALIVALGAMSGPVRAQCTSVAMGMAIETFIDGAPILRPVVAGEAITFRINLVQPFPGGCEFSDGQLSVTFPDGTVVPVAGYPGTPDVPTVGFLSPFVIDVPGAYLVTPIDADEGLLYVRADYGATPQQPDQENGILHTVPPQQTASAVSSIPLVLADLAVTQDSDVTVFCDGQPTEVRYSFTVTTGNGAANMLINATSNLCGAVPIVGGDDGDLILENGETWLLECTATIDAAADNVAMVIATTVKGGVVIEQESIVSVVTDPSPALGVSPSSGTICDGDLIPVCASAAGGTPPYTYVWTGPSGYIGDTACVDVVEPGVHEVEVTDVNGCSQTVTVQFDCPPGACCMPDGTCAQAAGEGACLGAGGTWQGVGTACDASTCPGGACCLADGSCDAGASAPDCTAAGGLWQGAATTCAELECPAGACCLSDGTCDLAAVPNDCTVIGGTWMGAGTDCGSTACPGACCLGFFNCVDVPDWATCTAQGGTYHGLDTACDATVCEGQSACCLSDGTCEIMLAIDCLKLGATPRDDGCADAGCAGVCCLNDGNCTEAGFLECLQQGGQFYGVGLQCQFFQCPAACCQADGTCLVTPDCPPVGGPGQGTTCDDFECPGACCLPEGTCLDDTVLDECTALGGVFNGLDSVCAGLVCPSACCLPDDSCVLVDEVECFASGGTPQGAGVGCVVSACGTACPADVNGDSMVDVTDLVAVVLAWGTADAAADIDQSGLVDVGDLVQVVLAWGGCS